MPPSIYHRFSRYLHWIMAALLFYMVFLGWTLEGHDTGRFARFQLHKSFGILILYLTLLRIGLRIAYKAPPELPGPKWQMRAAKVVHIGFYVLMIGLPLSGWAVVSASTLTIPTELFGFIPWPHLPVPVSEASHDTFAGVHGLLAKLLIYLLIPLHVGAALMHHFIHKDETLPRMLPGLEPQDSLKASLRNRLWLLPVGIIVGAAVLAFGLLRGAPTPPDAPVVVRNRIEVSASASVEASEIANPFTGLADEASTASAAVPSVSEWIVDKAASHIHFTTRFQKTAIRGQFATYEARILFDPQKLDDSSVAVTIDLPSVSTSDDERDATLKSPAFLDADTYPQAVFEATHFTALGDNRYVAQGELVLHGQTQAFELPFTLEISGDTASVTATAALDRLSFGVGSGEWASTSAIPAKVDLDIQIKAKRK